MPRHAIGVAALLSTALLVTTACTGSSPSQAPSTVSIGFLAPLSGPSASVGADTKRGAELAVEVVNGRHPSIPLPLGPGEGLPHLQHARLKLTVADTNGSTGRGATQVENLVNKRHVAAVAGGYESAVTAVASKRAEKLEVPFVNGGSSASSLTERGLEWFFRTGPSDLGHGQVIFSMLKQVQIDGTAVKRIAVVHTDDPYGSDGAAMIKRLASSVDGEVVADVPVDAGSAKLRDAAQAVKRAAPDVVLTFLYTPQAVALGESLRAAAYRPPALIAFGAGYADPAFLDKAGVAAAGICSRFAWSADLAERNPTAKAVADLYEKTYREPMNDDAARAFTAVMTLAQAVNSARSSAEADIRSALVNTDIPGRETIMPWDGVKFDDDHQNVGARGVVEQVNGGRYRLVYPFDVAQASLKWPMGDSAGG